ncbi:MAG: hypothetical protein H0X47_00455 [Nitrospirales bacterium]|nr:hypothetical protein [Nitrospirales bacterium]
MPKKIQKQEYLWFIGLFRELALLSHFSLEQEASDGKQRTVPALAGDQ